MLRKQSRSASTWKELHIKCIRITPKVLFKGMRETGRSADPKTFDMASKGSGFKSHLENDLPKLRRAGPVSSVTSHRKQSHPTQPNLVTTAWTRVLLEILMIRWVGQNILNFLRNSKVLCEVNKNPPSFPNHIHFPEVHFNILLQCTIRSSERSPPKHLPYPSIKYFSVSFLFLNWTSVDCQLPVYNVTGHASEPRIVYSLFGNTVRFLYAKI